VLFNNRLLEIVMRLFSRSRLSKWLVGICRGIFLELAEIQPYMYVRGPLMWWRVTGSIGTKKKNKSRRVVMNDVYYLYSNMQLVKSDHSGFTHSCNNNLYSPQTGRKVQKT